MSFIIKDLSYIHADKEILFSHLHLSINSGDKIALTGNNGCGKSTLMRILAGDLSPSSGTVLRRSTDVRGVAPFPNLETSLLPKYA